MKHEDGAAKRGANARAARRPRKPSAVPATIAPQTSGSAAPDAATSLAKLIPGRAVVQGLVLEGLPSNAPPPIELMRSSGAIRRARVPKPIDWPHWQMMPVVALWQAVALSLGQNPDDLPFNWDDEALNKRIRACLSNVDAGLLTLDAHHPANRRMSTVAVAEFTRWAAAVGLQLPDDFPRTASSGAREPEAQPSNTQPSKEEQQELGGIKPVQRLVAQEQAILAKLQDLGFDLTSLPYRQGLPSPAKRAVAKALGFTRDVMNKAWQRLLADGRIKNATTLGHDPRPNWPKA